MYEHPQSPATRRPFARPYSVFVMDFAQFCNPSPAEVAGVTVRACEAFRQSIASDGAPYVMQAIETREEKTARFLDQLRASEGTDTPFVAPPAPFYATKEAASLANDLYRCPRCQYVSTVPERCDSCGRHRD